MNKKIDVGIVLGNPHSDLKIYKNIKFPFMLISKQDSHLTKYEKINFDDLKMRSLVLYTYY